MRTVLFKCLPYSKEAVTLALESGVDGLIVPDNEVSAVSALSRVPVYAEHTVPAVVLSSKQDEEAVRIRLQQGEMVTLARDWEIIPVENLLAQCSNVLLEVGSLAEARLASGILERGADGIVVLADAISDLKNIVSECKLNQGHETLSSAVITRIEDAGLGHRVCVDTMSLMTTGQGMLVGNSSAFTFLVHAETEKNEYVAARPFRVNAGAVHAYTRLPEDKTCYLGELCAGRRVLIVNSQGETTIATVGRIKTEIRPMLLIEARVGDKTGTVFLQNAETIRLTTPDGRAVSVVTLKPGDEVLCRMDEAGRHFGMRVREDIREI